MQPDFCLAIMESLKGADVHLALDTCGGVCWQRLEPLVELADLVLFDMKTADAEAHQRYTGIPLHLVLDNAREITRLGRPMWIRTPIIPGFTDGEESIRRIARFIREELPTVERYELLAYNNLGRSKYERLGLEYPLADCGLMTGETMERLSRSASAEGIPFVRWSGTTRSEDAAAMAARPTNRSSIPLPKEKE
jgi:pyruvate formate lyase activating enzyme